MRHLKGVMADEAEEIIVALKSRFRVSTDQGLADSLKVGRSTVASWRSRGHVPRRYARFVNEAQTELFGLGIANWTEEERATAVLALMRMHRSYLAEIGSYTEFLKRGGFIPEVHVVPRKLLS